MSKKRVMIIAAGLLAVLAGIAIFGLFSNLNSLIAGAIEKYGSAATGTRVAVSGVDVSLGKGSGNVEGLRIGSPSGYKADDAFRLGRIHLDLDVASVRKNPIVIERLEITAPEIFAEIHKDGSSNLMEIRKHLERYAPATQASASSNSDRANEKRIRIDELVIAEGQVAVDASSLGIEPRKVMLRRIRLSDVGGASGAAPDALAKVIVSSLVSEAVSTVARSELERQGHKVLEGVLDQAKGLLEGQKK